MSTQIVIFPFRKAENDAVEVRTLNHEDGTTWFVLRDVLEAMDTATTRQEAITSIEQGLGDGVVDSIPILDRLGREQQITIIAESAATYLVSRSNTEAGRKLNRFIHTEVLPQIRRTGRYVPANVPVIDLQERKVALAERVLSIAQQHEDEVLRVLALDSVKNALMLESPERKETGSGFFQAYDVLESLGYAPKDIQASCSRVGKALKKAYLQDTGEAPKTVLRVVHGASRATCVYPRSWFERAKDVVGTGAA